MSMFYCPLCGHKLLWQSDFTFEDYGYEGEGIVGLYTCPNKQTCGIDLELITSLSDEADVACDIYSSGIINYFHIEDD